MARIYGYPPQFADCLHRAEGLFDAAEIDAIVAEASTVPPDFQFATALPLDERTTIGHGRTGFTQTERNP